MPMVEVDEEQLRRDSVLRATVAKILQDPKAKRLMEQAHKMVDKDAVTPGLDTEEKIEAAVGATKAEIEALKKQLAEDREKREHEAKVGALQKSIEDGIAKLVSEGWMPDGITAVRKLMEDKGIVDPAIAAAYYEKTHPAPAPVAGGGGPWNFIEASAAGDDPDWKKLIETKGENDAIVDKMARDALNDMRGVPRR
jgi:hypothetical protein